MFGKISNLPFVCKMDGAYESTTSRDFKTPAAVQGPKEVRFSLYITNFNLQDKHRGATETTHSSTFKSLPTSRAQILRPRTSVRTSFTGKLPEPTYRTTYTPHEVSPVLRVKESAKTGVGLSLNQEKKNLFSSATQEAYQRRRPTPSAPLESVEKKHVQYSSVVLGDREKITDTQTSYSSSFRSHGNAKECLLPSIKKNQPFNLREMSEDQWVTSSKVEFRPVKPEAPVLLERRHRNASNILKVDIPKDRQEKVSTTNHCFFPEVTRPEFPVHVDGPSIRTKSRVYFGKPGAFYGTTAQDHFSVKEGVCAKPTSHPPQPYASGARARANAHIHTKTLCVPERRKTRADSERASADSHIRFREAKPDFSTTHGEMFVPKPYFKLPRIHSYVRNISHMPF
ncbi:hypothetical protein DNTS_027847 [Danionella cerebrum]|uniref:Uncharacterized protein n=1 Tax=Danionella cerebrum TaxID=2873325 RepID=A0A553QHM9_9TELE|nr:hypothetical protein DNTS_027847 [Danionella translucida]